MKMNNTENDWSNKSVFRNVYNQSYLKQHENRRIFYSTKDSIDYLQRIDLLARLKIHRGCVNSICWNDSGQYILSGSDDQTIVISNPFTKRIFIQYKTPHRANIFCARFLPQSNDRGIVSCSGDGIVLYSELTATNLNGSKNEKNGVCLFNCHNNGTTYEVMTMPTEPRSFMSCGEDGTVRLYDLRSKSGCHKTYCKDNILILSPSAITAMTISPISHYYIAIGGSDSLVRIYDRRFLSLIDFTTPDVKSDKHTIPVKAFTIPSLKKRPYRITSVKYCSDEQQLLANYSSDYLYLLDVTKNGINLNTIKNEKLDKKTLLDSPPPVRRLRLRGDWSDTGPNARPERDFTGSSSRMEAGQVRPQLQGSILFRMTEILSRMLADPRTRAGLSSITNNSGTNDNATAQEFENFAEMQVINEPQPGPSKTNTNTNEFKEDNTENNWSDTDDDDDVENKTNLNSSKPNNVNKNDNNNLNNNEAILLKEELEKIELETKKSLENSFNYIVKKYVGHRNARTMIKEAVFWGNNYVMSGSDCGHIFIWNRFNGKLEMLLEGDSHVVNCLQPHPTLPYLATSGIDYDVKVWAPIRDKSGFNEDVARDLMERNAIMLEETKDTITVPGAFMVRMLAYIHSLRNRRVPNNSNQTQNNNNENESNSSNN